MQLNVNQQEIGRLIQTGVAALQQKNAKGAKEAFEAIVAKGAANASVWLGLAYAYRDLADMDQMLDAIDRSLAVEPRNARAYILKADAHVAKRDMQAAAAFYLKALNVAPPPGQTPPDLQAELVRAQQRFAELSSDFARHLTEEMRPKLSEAGQAANRVKNSIDLMTGKRQLPPSTVPYPSRPKNYFMPDLPHVEFYDSRTAPWMKEIEAATDEIRQELKALIEKPDSFSPYVTGETNRPQSDPHGMKNNRNWSAFYLWRDGATVVENMERCPKTAAAMEKVPLTDIPGRAPNVLFSVLRAGAKIPPHNGLLNTRFICHLPLIVPQGCGFRVGGQTREWQEDKLWMFDDSVEHEAWNNSDQDRYILLFEMWRPEVSEVEQRLVSDIFSAIDSYGK